MERQISLFTQARLTTLKVIEDLTLDELCRIPNGFNNSILWNLGHLAVTQQLLCYKLSNTEMYILDQDFIEAFRKGSTPKKSYSQQESDKVLSLFKSIPLKMENDWKNNVFGTGFNYYETSFGVNLYSIEDAISFNNIHEGMHFGYILALKRTI